MGNKLFSRYLEARWGAHAAAIETVAACPLCAGGCTKTLWGFLLKMYLIWKENILFKDILFLVASDPRAFNRDTVCLLFIFLKIGCLSGFLS